MGYLADLTRSRLREVWLRGMGSRGDDPLNFPFLLHFAAAGRGVRQTGSPAARQRGTRLFSSRFTQSMARMRQTTMTGATRFTERIAEPRFPPLASLIMPTA